MSGEKTTSPCSKFQANIFNKSKCQNCFKSRELHLLNDHDMEQAKPIYGGWLCLAPEGTDFDNPMQRSRKWQRRFFILYEHGSLSFALDELPSTLPQGTVNMNLCTDIADAEPRTGQRNALCVITPEQEIFIRGDNKEIINGWSEQLAVYLRTNKQNQKKKRKVEPVTNQEPSPAKMAATHPSFPCAESAAAESGCGRWQEEQRGRGPDKTPFWTVTDSDPPGLEQTPAGNTSTHLRPVSRDSLTLDGPGSFASQVGSLDLAINGSTDPGSNNQLAELEPNNIQISANNKNHSYDRSPTERLLSSEATKKEHEGGTAASRKGRSEARTNKREKLQSCGDTAQLTALPPQRRAKSLDRRTSDTVMTPDLLNFKKGWMVKLDENDKWKKYWFVLSADSLRYYKDSIAEEASDLEGEIDLTKCFNVSEYQVQRNYGFQIHTPKGVYTLSAMTAGIRKNWIQALMKNVHPANAPDVASLPSHHFPCSPPEALPKPDVTQDSSSTEIPTERDPHPKPKSVMERRREGRYKTFDWAEFRPQSKPTSDTDPQKSKALCSLELGDLERRKRREERRRKYESMLGFSLGWEASGDESADGSDRAMSPKSQQRMEEEMEDCWKQVEKTVFRLERTVPLYNDVKDTAEMEKLLDSYRKGVEDLKAQLEDSERRRLELEAQLSAAERYQQQVCKSLDPSPSSEADFFPLDTNEKPLNNHTQSLNDTYKETIESLEQQNVIRQEQLTPAPPLIASQHTPEHQTPSIWLHDTDGNLQELGDLLPDCPEAVDTPLLSPASDSTDLLSESEEQTVGLNLDDVITNQQNQQDKEDCQLFPNSETQINNSEYSSSSFILENPAERDDASLSCCVEQHTPPDQVILRRLSQEVELLTSQNEALNQRNQEMLNQLTEADREIERLKAELSSRYTEPHHLPEVEQLGQTHVQDLERELSMREQQLQEAQTLITSLEENLRDTETLLQTGVTTETEETGQEESDCAKKAEGYLLRCFEATEAKLTELERQLDQSELTCRKLRAQNTELKEAEKVYCERAAETEADIRRLNQDLEREKLKEGERNRSVCGEERIQQVIEEMIMRLKALGKLLEVIDRLDFDTIKRSTESEEEEKPAVVSQLKWEEEFWGLLLNEVKVKTSQLSEEKAVDVLLSEVTEHMIVEKQMLLLGHDLLSEREKEKEDLEGTYESETLKDLDDIWKSVTASETKKIDDTRKFDFSNRLCEMDKNVMERFRVTTQMKTSLLDEIASSVSTSARDKLRSMADRLSDSRFSEHPGFRFIHSAATEAMYCCHINRLQSTYQRELEETKQRLLTCSLICSDCVDLTEENRELRARLSNLEEQQTSSSAAKTNACCQTEETHLQNTDTELQMGDESAADGIETGNVPETSEETAENESSLSCMEIPLSSGEGHWGIQEISDENTEKNEASRRETDPSEQVLALRRRVEELEEQLSVIAEELKEEFDGKMSSAQTQHEKEMEKLKATCERGFASMEESHVKVVEELQRRHQQEVERLLVERDRLLEEESAATATAIEAIKNAHRLELEREVQKRCRSENITGNTHLEDIYRQHTEELASYQRELEVLSEQYSLKCLENVHLVQAVDAERKALCQCQQENQDLRTRNQELSGHLAAEITRLCSLAKQDALPLSQGMNAYEMEITLRVKESEVQCLKQEITSLKDELQSAQRDKRNITKKYKDMYTELSITRAKAERDIDQLRENLRLVHQALRQTSP
ncbi:myosin phosphatase Rho-interacting protein-like [Thunnus maccoyii]|uniref:myosin phosphatase Rho-interacting protein-like n=1 Tax=Thunnus maccoyii TaxID=8240 RepID=UPI001C4BCB24|nr:myosin phosphatase Rho-interacting protein-like [Thunnus maccoyii]